jgi:hypothetical protein
MLAKIISALALTLLLTGGASAFIPQPQESLQAELFAPEHAQQEQSLQTELFAAEPHNIYAGHSNSVEPSAVSEMFADAAEPHNIYAGHSNNAEPQESLQTQLFAADTMLSEPRQFDWNQPANGARVALLTVGFKWRSGGLAPAAESLARGIAVDDLPHLHVSPSTAPSSRNSLSGTVFELVHNGGGSYTFTTVTSIGSSGYPQSTLIADAAGNLFGTAPGGPA